MWYIIIVTERLYIMNYQAYLYRYTHVPSNRAYIGIHKGLKTDAYNHSSTCEEFGHLLRTEFHNFKYEVLETGSLGAMLNKEHKMLKAVNAKSNPNYFNKSNGSPASPEFDETRGLELVAKIKKMTGKQEDATTIAKSVFIQVSMADNYTHVQDIRCAIDEVHGDTAKLGLKAVILEGYFGEDEEEYGVDGGMGLGGNHSTKGTVSSKHGTTIEVIRIAYEEWEGMSDTELEFVGMLLNKQEGKVKPKTNETADLSKIVQSLYYNHNIDLKSDDMRMKLEHFDVPKRKITSAINRAIKAIETQKLITAGQKIIDWTQGAAKKRLYEVILPQYNDGETYVEVLSSGSYGSLLTFLSNFNASERDYKKAVAIVRHPNTSYKNDWLENDKYTSARNVVEVFMKNAGVEYEEVGLKLLQNQKKQVEIE